MELFSCPEDTGGPLGAVYTVGEVLGFQTEGTAEAVGLSLLAGSLGQDIGGIELHTGLVCVRDHGNAALIATGDGYRVIAQHKVAVISTEGLDTRLVPVSI